MFDNIGSKLKKLAKAMCLIGIALSVIVGIMTMIGGSSYRYSGTSGAAFVAGLLTIVLGSLGSWVGSFFTYGFGQLIENTDTIDYRLTEIEKEVEKISGSAKTDKNV